MKRMMALLVMAVLVVAGSASAINVSTKLAQGNLADSDSLGATPDTSDVFTIRDNATAWRVVVWCDSASVYTTQVSQDGARWFTVDVDTTVANILEYTADFGAVYPGWNARLIFDGLWSTGKKVGQAFLAYTR